ncbi:MAG: PLP-dependent aminotransferase family protein [Chloroflexi bacterium]|nr:PLP-dependent aminotransferase family protein [Chloroflexota bacterium]
MKEPLPSLLISIAEGVIDLGWGHPSPGLHPVALLKQATDHVLGGEEPTPLQYGAVQGFGPLLESLAAFLTSQPAYGFPVEPETLFLTAGASQGLDLCCTLFANAGDTVYVEEPTYYLVERIFEDHHLNVVGVPTDGDGLRTDALEEMLQSNSLPGPRLLYTIPTYQNPTGSVLSQQRRHELLRLADSYGFLVLADEVYQMLHYGPPPPRPLFGLDGSEAGVVISLGSFSKILSPGLRTGWIQANPRLIGRFLNAGLSVSGGGLNHFTSTLVHAAISLGLLDSNVAHLRETYGGREDAMDRSIREHLGARVSYTRPGGGYYFWLNFNGELDTEALHPIAQEVGVDFRPGNAFSLSGRFPHALRVCFALYESDQLDEGIARLAKASALYDQRPCG